MATMTVGGIGSGGFDINALSISALFNYNFSLFSGTTLFRVYDNPFYFTEFTGTGFAGTGAPGRLTDVTAGTVNTVTVVSVGALLMQISGASFSAAALFDAYVADNTQAGWDLALGGGDTVTGTGFADVLKSFGGDDIIIGGGGADQLFGGQGDDVFSYLAVSELAAGEVISGDAGAYDEIAVSGAGDFNLSSAVISGVELLRFAGDGTATLTGTQIGVGGITQVIGDAVAVNGITVNGAAVDLSAVSFYNGIDGVDLININGTAGIDNLIGSYAWDIIQSGAGADFLYGAGGNDQLYGGSEADYMSGGDGSDYLSGGVGGDIFFGGAGADTIIGGGGDDQYYGIDVSDIIVEYAGEGDDRIFTDVSYALSSGSEIETLSTSFNVSAFDINLTGNTLNNIIIGNNGVNILDGGLGNDTLYGLGGSVDYFTFSTVANTSTNSDTIADWSSAGDLIFIDDAAFTGMAAGTLAASAFLSGAGLTAAATLAQRVIVNTVNGDLWWDQDGLGGLASVRFANIGAAHPVFNYDFFGI